MLHLAVYPWQPNVMHLLSCYEWYVESHLHTYSKCHWPPAIILSYSTPVFCFHTICPEWGFWIESLKTVLTLKPWNSIDSWVVWASFLFLRFWSWLVECGRTCIDECTSSFCGWTTNLYLWLQHSSCFHPQTASVSMATKTTYSVVSIESHLSIHANVTDQDVFKHNDLTTSS